MLMQFVMVGDVSREGLFVPDGFCDTFWLDDSFINSMRQRIEMSTVGFPNGAHQDGQVNHSQITDGAYAQCVELLQRCRPNAPQTLNGQWM